MSPIFQNRSKVESIFMKVIIANDTRIEKHHGCSRVMNTIDRNLYCRNVEISKYIKLLEYWDSDENIKRDILQTDLVIINGEGSLHDDNPYINRLLSLIEFCKHYNLPVVIINATISNLSKKNLELLKQATAIYVRESCSYDYLLSHDIKSLVVPDLTFWNSDGFDNTQNDSASKKIGYTDSVLKKSAVKIDKYAKNNQFDYINIFNNNDYLNENIITILQKKRVLRFLRKSFKKAIKQYFLTKRRNKNGIYQKQNQVDFIANLNEYKFIFTGRYHMVCFCLIMKIPFFAISSSTYKIEGLLQDAGLNSARLITPDEINLDLIFDFSADEISNIETFLIESNSKIDTMFNQIVSLAEKNHQRKTSLS
jgi:polysaccharide pyruvyl transferase WcaK-like protein